MSKTTLDRLLLTLDVTVDAFAICEVRHGLRLVGRPKNAIEIHYVLAGTMFLTASDRDPITCGPGSLVLLPPRTPQIIATDQPADRDVLAVENCRIVQDGIHHFDAAEGRPGDLRIVCGAISVSMAGSYGLLDGLRAPLVEAMDDLAIVRQAYDTMLAELAEPGLGSRALTGALMKTCLMLALRRYFARGQESGLLLGTLRDARLGKSVADIMERPAALHSVATLASAAGMSRSAFAREFSDAFGLGPMEFVAKVRLRHASNLLRSTGVPVKVVAAISGFSSRSHFSRAFRRAYGADPSKFRKMTAESEGKG